MLIEHLRTRDVMSVFHYLPLHLSEMDGGSEVNRAIAQLPSMSATACSGCRSTTISRRKT